MITDWVACGVIGCGRMGKRRIKSIQEHPHARLIGVTDSMPEYAEAVAREYGVVNVTSYELLLEDPSIDVIFVCVPNKFHAELVKAAFVRGKHVFCEKPLARTVAEAEEMVRAAVQAQKTFKTGSNLRYFPNVVRAKALLDEGAIGTPLFMRGWIGHDGWNLSENWFSQVEVSGGGTFLDNGAHIFDLARWFMGEFVECTGMTDLALWKLDSLEDNAVGIFKTTEGRLATVHASWTDWSGYTYMEVYGADGFVRIDSRGRTCATVLGDRNGQTTTFDFSDLPPTSYNDEMVAYLAALRSGRQVVPSGHDGLRAVRMAHGVYESARASRMVSIYEENDQELERLECGSVIAH